MKAKLMFANSETGVQIDEVFEIDWERAQLEGWYALSEQPDEEGPYVFGVWIGPERLLKPSAEPDA